MKQHDSHREVHAGVVGDPEDVMIDDNEVAGDGVVLVLHVLVHALFVVHRHRQARRRRRRRRRRSKKIDFR